MFDYTNFSDVFSFNQSYSYDQSTVEGIEARRKSLEGLFVDRVLKLLDIKRPAKHYPPKSNAELRNLHQAIVAGNSTDHTKLSLLYYLLLDCNTSARRDAYSDKFEEISSLPKRNQIYMKGLWHMDRMEFEMALQYLTHPSLLPTFHEEILHTLIHYSNPDDFTLALAYYHTVQPTITNSLTLESLFAGIARTSVIEAFYFLRGQPDIARYKMFESLISIVLQTPASEKAAARGVELVNLPFNPEEEAWFEQFLTVGAGRGFRRAKDTMMMRKIGMGKYSEALLLDGADSRSLGGLTWETMVGGLQEGLGPRVNVGRRSN